MLPDCCDSPSLPSLCIPRVTGNIHKDQIFETIFNVHLGNIERIDVVHKKNERGEHFQRVFIHFQQWYDNENAIRARERILSGKDIKIIYDDPWFWKISANRSTKK